MSMKAVRDDRAPAGQIPPPLLDLIRRAMKCGSNEPVGVDKVSIAPNVDNDRRRISA
jgi:hypothetical protein